MKKTDHAIRAHSVAGATLLILLAPSARADLSDPRLLAQLGPLERVAAAANQAAYNALTGGTSPICAANLAAPTGACSGRVFTVFKNVRALVQTANALGGSGPTRFSLGLNTTNLGEALRWTAPEELAAHRSAAMELSGSEVGAVTSRLETLRLGLTGSPTFEFSQPFSPPFNLPREVSGALPLGLFGAASDADGILSRLSAYFNASYGYGSRRDTTQRGGYEDAFDFSTRQGKLGMDYRLSPRVVLGTMVGFVDRVIDFDSRASIVDADIQSGGASLTAYGQWQTERLYLSASLGGQRLEHQMRRRITYPSFNPLVPSVDSTAFSHTYSNALLATFNIGYDFRRRGTTLEPYLKGEFQGLIVQGFTEADPGGFAFRYGSEQLQSFDIAAGARVQRVFTPSFGVIVPYFRADYHRELDPGSSTNSATYDGLGSLGAAARSTDFNLPTDRQDTDYFQLAGGLSLVMHHGVQAFFQYQQTLGLEPFRDLSISGGVRLEF